MMLDKLPIYPATRYLVPLREGGSLPAVVDTEGGGKFVVKFRGAGQGARALLAEILVAGIAETLGLPVPKLALITLDKSFGRAEKDPEIQDILRASEGLNVGLKYLEGALNYDPAVAPEALSPQLAARIVWLDALVLNVDRTARNPNMMLHDGALCLIDHGAAFYLHHNWQSASPARIRQPFSMISDHILLPHASNILEPDDEMASAVMGGLEAIVERLPDELLMDAPTGRAPAFQTPEENRQAYRSALSARLRAPRAFAAAAEEARQEVLSE